MNRTLWFIFWALFLASLVLEFTVLAGVGHHWWNSIPAFYGIFGFVCCVAIIFVAKFVGTHFLNRDLDYYDR